MWPLFPVTSIVKEFSVIKKKSPIYFGPSPTTGWQCVHRDTICKNAEQTQGSIVTIPSHAVAAPSVQASAILVRSCGVTVPTLTTPKDLRREDNKQESSGPAFCC